MRKRVLMRVDLPHPVRPTIPIFSLALMLKDKPFRTRSRSALYRTCNIHLLPHNVILCQQRHMQHCSFEIPQLALIEYATAITTAFKIRSHHVMLYPVGRGTCSAAWKSFQTLQLALNMLLPLLLMLIMSETRVTNIQLHSACNPHCSPSHDKFVCNSAVMGKTNMPSSRLSNSL